MAQASINVRTDSELKQDFAKLCSDRGLSVSAAINKIMKFSVENNKLPINAAEFEEETFVDDEELKRMYDDVKAGKGLVEFDFRGML